VQSRGGGVRSGFRGSCIHVLRGALPRPPGAVFARSKRVLELQRQGGTHPELRVSFPWPEFTESGIPRGARYKAWTHCSGRFRHRRDRDIHASDLLRHIARIRVSLFAHAQEPAQDSPVVTRDPGGNEDLPFPFDTHFGIATTAEPGQGRLLDLMRWKRRSNLVCSGCAETVSG